VNARYRSPYKLFMHVPYLLRRFMYSGTTVTLTAQANLRRVDLYIRTATEKVGEFKHRWSDPPTTIQAANDAIIGTNDDVRENYAAVKIQSLFCGYLVINSYN
ncbi:hypothetical protein M8C21_030124, partial [Ambrosia artemisiifolia]